MSLSRAALNTLIAGAFAVTLAGVASHPAFAAGTDKEKCYGIAKAGKNDCADLAKVHSCAGQAKMDGAGGDFLLLPKGVCDKIAGGSMKVTDVTGTMPPDKDSK